MTAILPLPPWCLLRKRERWPSRVRHRGRNAESPHHRGRAASKCGLSDPESETTGAAVDRGSLSQGQLWAHVFRARSPLSHTECEADTSILAPDAAASAAAAVHRDRNAGQPLLMERAAPGWLSLAVRRTRWL